MLALYGSQLPQQAKEGGNVLQLLGFRHALF